MSKDSLPRLLYVGDVPIESSYHGSLLLYRLLQDYPPEKLRIIEGNLHPSEPERRLRNVRYESFFVGIDRLLRTRLRKFYSTMLIRSARRRARRVQRLLHGFRADAVLTVSHGYSWITAAEFATKNQLPLHLVCHDDWPSTVAAWPGQGLRIRELFADIYGQAVSRFCVSEGMEDIYHRQFGVGGLVLYPSRGKTSPQYDSPAPDRAGRSLTIGYAGSLTTPDYRRALIDLAAILHETNGRIVAFVPSQPDFFSDTNIDWESPVGSFDLIKQLRHRVDVLYVPMSFDPAERAAVEMSFPSKLTDYTASGAPLLIQAPEYSSVVGWARRSGLCAEMVTSISRDSLRRALTRLQDYQWRQKLAASALAVGQAYFGADTAKQIFHKALRQDSRDAIAEKLAPPIPI